jgi:16S rRNA (uracil1498-N3)-methyltransferase
VNLILLDPGEVAPDGTARLGGRRAAHVLGVLGASPGDRLHVGLVGGRMGSGEVLSLTGGEVVLRVTLDRDPPPRSPVDLLLALPRPKILRKVLQAAAAMGIGRLELVGSYRVEKSYFSSPVVSPAGLEADLRLGLEQARDTILPSVRLHRWFKPFVEDELDPSYPQGIRLLAHPAAEALLGGTAPGGRSLLAIGPEGGWTPHEERELSRRGFRPFSLGPRALRVDAAVPFAVGQVELWLRAAGAGSGFSGSARPAATSAL